jgi:ribosomal-protein-alanine N-acetyltransferase
LNLIIRRLREYDIDQVIKIEEVTFGEFHWSRESFCSEIENDLGNYFVAIEENTKTLVGYCGFWAIIDEAHITTLAVHPDFKGNKISEALLQQMVKTAYEKKLKWFTLEVRMSNLPAINLYKKYGFESLGVREKYYQDNNEDAVIMWTDNIWFDKFKNSFHTLQKAIEEKVTVVSC